MSDIRNIRGIESQQTFPLSDLTEDNAAILEMILGNNEILRESHAISEKSTILYAQSHFCVNSIAKRLDTQTASDGANFGAMIYEVAASFVNPSAMYYDKLAIVHGVHRLTLSEKNNDTLDILVDARDRLLEECPNLSQLVTEVTGRKSPRLANAALAGAGLMRDSELCVQRDDFTS